MPAAHMHAMAEQLTPAALLQQASVPGSMADSDLHGSRSPIEPIYNA